MSCIWCSSCCIFGLRRIGESSPLAFPGRRLRRLTFDRSSSFAASSFDPVPQALALLAHLISQYRDLFTFLRSLPTVEGVLQGLSRSLFLSADYTPQQHDAPLKAYEELSMIFSVGKTSFDLLRGKVDDHRRELGLVRGALSLAPRSSAHVLTPFFLSLHRHPPHSNLLHLPPPSLSLPRRRQRTLPSLPQLLNRPRPLGQPIHHPRLWLLGPIRPARLAWTRIGRRRTRGRLGCAPAHYSGCRWCGAKQCSSTSAR